MIKYNLINPCLKSNDIESSMKANNPLQAAEYFYNKISKNFLSPVIEFRFTLGEGKKLHHFEVKEDFKGKNDATVSYKITPYLGKVDEKTMRIMSKKFEEQIGGRHKRHRRSRKYDKDEDDSSSSTISDSYSDRLYYRRVRFPISTWWYNPYTYLIDSDLLPIPTVLADSILVPGILGLGPSIIYLGNKSSNTNNAQATTGTTTATATATATPTTTATTTPISQTQVNNNNNNKTTISVATSTEDLTS